MSRSVEQREITARGVGEYVDAIESEMFPQPFDVLDLPVAVIGRGVVGKA